MDRKKILIITHGFFPNQSPRALRATELAKELSRQGHDVTVMTTFWEGMFELTEEFDLEIKSLGKREWSIYNFNESTLFGRIYNRLTNRLLPLFFEYPFIELYFKVKNALKRETTNFDLLISIAIPYPIHWGVASVWKIGGNNLAVKWIADCGDPYCLQENDTFQPPFYFKWVEKWFMRKTDYVTVPTINSFKGYFPEFHNKLRVIPQGFRFEDIQKQNTIVDGIIRFGYGGVFIPGKRDPREFLEFLIALPKNLRYEFHIYTATSHLLTSYAQLDKRILLHRPIKRNELLKTLSSFQFVVNFANKGASQTPSKLIDYSIIEKPILNIETGKLDEKIILEFLQGNYLNAFRILDVEEYRIENVARAFLKLS